jgi:hypothetical protein
MADVSTGDLSLEEDDDFFWMSNISTVVTLSKSNANSVKKLAKAWKLDHATAQRTINANSQRNERNHNHTLERNTNTNDRFYRYRHINHCLYMDTMISAKKNGKSTRQNTCAHIMVTDKGFIKAYPLEKRAHVKDAIRRFCKDIGVPVAFICDPAGEQTSKEVKSFIREAGSTLRILEEGTQWANRAELIIGQLKAGVRRVMKDAGVPLPFWDYCLEWKAMINNHTAKSAFALQGQTPHFSMFGREGDISAISSFGFFDFVYFRDHTQQFPMATEVLGRYLGKSHGVGNAMACWILKGNGKVVARRTLRPLNDLELRSEVEKTKRERFTALTTERFGDAWTPGLGLKDEHPLDADDEFDEDYPSSIPDEPPVDSSGKLLNQQPAYDKLIKAEVKLPQRGQNRRATVLGRSVDTDTGRTTGTFDENPYLNSVIYDVGFPDGEIKQYAANIIAENMYSQVDADGFQTNLLNSILDFKTDETAVAREDMYVTRKSGNRGLKKTTAGWKLLVLWKDGFEEWVPLKDMKDSYPIEVAEFAKARGISEEPAFKWWVTYTLKKRNVLVSAVKARLRRVTHKYGIAVPTSVAHALELDKANGNDFWSKAIAKEMTNVGIAFEILEPEQNLPVGYSKATGHLIFDVKMDFTRKARWVLDGHKCEKPDISSYAGVVSRESIRIALTYAALNGVDVFAADIQNAYLQAPTSVKHYIICGREFGLEHEGKRALIVRALYGGKTAGRDFRNHLRDCMDTLKFQPCLADPDVWMRPSCKDGGEEYYEYVLLHTDDALVISHQAESILRNEIGKYFGLKEASIGPPTIYLGGKMRKVRLDNDMEAWAYSSSQYVQQAVKNVEQHLSDRGARPLPAKANAPIKNGYRPEIDISTTLTPHDAAYFQSLIGILRWIVELGRVDICCEVSMLSSQLVLPREGHLEQVFHIFGYLKRHHNAEMVFDPSDPEMDYSQFERKDWSTSEFGMVQPEKLPPNAPKELGQGFIMRLFVDADHASDTVTRRSRSGYLCYLNSAPITWFSKKQTSVETSSFGSEFVAMKHGTEYVRGLRYKLRMMGIPVSGPTYIYGDNQSVLFNTTIPESTLKRKSQSICYHFVREGSARDEWRTGYVNTKNNPSDILTKPVPSGQLRMSLVRMILHHLYDTEWSKLCSRTT